jgi:hypothetical protein
MSAMIGSKIYKLGDFLNLPADVAKTAVDAGILVREDLPKGSGEPVLDAEPIVTVQTDARKGKKGDIIEDEGVDLDVP